MRTARGRLHGTRWQALGAALLLLVSALLVAQRCRHAADAAWLPTRAGAPWLMAPTPVTADLQQEPGQAVFVRRFDGAALPGKASLRVHAFRSAEVVLDGQRLATVPAAERSWLGGRELVLPALRPGPNELRIAVSNPRGPALLSVAGPGPLATGAGWEVVAPGLPPRTAVVADDTRPHPAAPAARRATVAVGRHAGLLLALFASGALAAWTWSERAGPRLRRALPTLALAGALALFASSVAAVYARIPVKSGFGFDLGNHLAYVVYVRDALRLPLATDGWSTYHPPLFYAVSAAAMEVASRLAPALDPASALRVLPFLSGLALVLVSHRLARRLLPGDGAGAALAAVFAAGAPVNLYMAAYPSNELPHAALSAGALWLGVSALLAERAAAATVLSAGVLLGLALLTKFTALLLVPILGFFLGAKLVLLERAPAGRCLGLLGLLGASVIAPCGWWYGRNMAEFGRPLVGNWNLPEGGITWWQHPGFHTTAYYTGFGASLERPLFSGFEGFLDSVYSTFWLDAYLGGRATVTFHRAAFDYDLASAIPLLALPATAALVLGGVRAIARAFGAAGRTGRERAAWSFLLVTLWTVGLAMVAVTLELPYFAQARAPYGLLALPVLALLFAVAFAPRGGASPERRLPGGTVGSCLLAGWLAALFGASWLTLLQ